MAERVDDLERCPASGAVAVGALRARQQRQRHPGGDGDRLAVAVITTAAYRVEEAFKEPVLRGPPAVGAARRGALPGQARGAAATSRNDGVLVGAPPSSDRRAYGTKPGR